ncbi:ryncolin-4-like [Drosophila innubila]|uniref:ryncolin-4-like n=1 Tax=Drosophila innubila TaxID=198719 RepID=UPI00148DB178|nr:ryncolin-4-like [Drosophila innubila]
MSFFRKSAEDTQNQLNECEKNVTNTQKQLQDITSKLTDCKNSKNNNENIKGKQQRTSQTTPPSRLTNPCLSSKVGPQNIHLGNNEPFQVLCENSWMIIQRRLNGNENFNKTWKSYVDGFGSLQGEFFLGLEKLHLITNSQTYQLCIKVVDSSNIQYNAYYDYFEIGNSSAYYKLNSVGNLKGSSYNPMRISEQMVFTTYDFNNNMPYNCPNTYGGGWWYTQQCHGINLNGPYRSFLYWPTKKQKYIRFKRVDMKIRPKY